jgi:hypothetical protein
MGSHMAPVVCMLAGSGGIAPTLSLIVGYTPSPRCPAALVVPHGNQSRRPGLCVMQPQLCSPSVTIGRGIVDVASHYFKTLPEIKDPTCDGPWQICQNARLCPPRPTPQTLPVHHETQALPTR